MRHLPLDRRGYPIFMGTWIDAKGQAHFTINDEVKRQRHITDDLCPICGQKLLRGRWFVGGPGSAFHDQGSYIDPPMHAECARYSLQVCPYLAVPSYGKRIDARKVDRREAAQHVFLDPTLDPQRPPLFVAVMASGARHIMGEMAMSHKGKMVGKMPFVQYVKPHRPYIRVEFWQHGALIGETTKVQCALCRRVPVTSIGIDDGRAFLLCEAHTREHCEA